MPFLYEFKGTVSLFWLRGPEMALNFLRVYSLTLITLIFKNQNGPRMDIFQVIVLVFVFSQICWFDASTFINLMPNYIPSTRQ